MKPVEIVQPTVDKTADVRIAASKTADGKAGSIELKGDVTVEGKLTVKDGERPRLRGTKLWNAFNALKGQTEAAITRLCERKTRISKVLDHLTTLRDAVGYPDHKPDSSGYTARDYFSLYEDLLTDLNSEVIQEAELAIGDEETRERYKAIQLTRLEAEALTAQAQVTEAATDLTAQIAAEETKARLLKARLENAKLERELTELAAK